MLWLPICVQFDLVVAARYCETSATFTYDPMNRPATASYADGSTVSWTWDLAGRLKQTQDSIGGTITRDYDDFDHLKDEISPQGTTTYTYDAAGRRWTMLAGSQAQVTYGYDDANELTNITQLTSRGAE